jgi:hypothetical protein
MTANKLFERNGYDVFLELMSLADAARVLKVDESTLRKKIATGKFIENIDCKKFGKQWVISTAAMEREYKFYEVGNRYELNLEY